MLRLLLTVLLAWVVGPAWAEIGEIRVTDLPPEAIQTLERIYRGGPFPHKRDGLIFHNREKRLPAKPRGYYLEYTVPTPGARDRGARRIVIGRGATADIRRAESYYTDDHYRTFQRITRE